VAWNRFRFEVQTYVQRPWYRYRSGQQEVALEEFWNFTPIEKVYGFDDIRGEYNVKSGGRSVGNVGWAGVGHNIAKARPTKPSLDCSSARKDVDLPDGESSSTTSINGSELKQWMEFSRSS